MGNALEAAGAAKEPSQYATLSMDRQITGLWTQRSALRDADVPYMVAKFYGASRFDSLIDGINRELSSRLTTVRRPGSSVWNGSTFPAINEFYPFKFIRNGIELIKILADGADGNVYDCTSGKTTLFAKGAGAGTTRFCGVNRELFFSDGVEEKKMLEGSTTWQADTFMKAGKTIVDGNGNIQLSVGVSEVDIASYSVAGGTLRINFADARPSEWIPNVVVGAIGCTVNIGINAQDLFIARAGYNWIEVDGWLDPDTDETDETGFCFSGNALAPCAYSPYWVTVTSGICTMPITVSPFAPHKPYLPPFWGAGTQVTFYQFSNLPVLNGKTVTLLSAGSSQITFALNVPDTSVHDVGYVYGPGAYTGDTEPTWATTPREVTAEVPTGLNGSWAAWNQWICYGARIQDWGLDAPTEKLSIRPLGMAGATCRYWAKSLDVQTGYAIMDKNGYIQYMAGATPYGGRVIYPGLLSNGDPALDAYQDTNKAIDGNPDTFSYLIMQHINRTGTAIFSFPSVGSVPPTMRLNILSHVPVNGETFPGTDYTYGDDGNYWDKNRNVIISGASSYAKIDYSTNGGSTWTNIYNSNGNRDKQWDTINLAGIDPANVQVRCETHSEDDMCHYVYSISLTIEESVPTASGSRKTGKTYPNFNTALYGTTVDGDAIWINCGRPVSRIPGKVYDNSGPTGSCIDANGNLQVITTTGTAATGSVTWAPNVRSTTTDGTVVWTNCGLGAVVAATGYRWGYAFHQIDGHVTDISALSDSSGPVLGIMQAPLSAIGSDNDWCDEIWMFRTADGQADPVFSFSIPNLGESVRWSDADRTVDLDLIAQIPAPVDYENSSPPSGMVAPVFHLRRIWAISENTVRWSGGPDTVTGNPYCSFDPINSIAFPSQPIRLMPLTINGAAMLVLTTTDIHIILGTGEVGNSFYEARYMPGVGLLNYDALDIIGSTLYLMTNKLKFVSLDPGAGYTEVGFPIGDQFSNLTTGGTDAATGAIYSAANTRITWHEKGSGDTAIYVADGSVGWFRFSPISSPESGYIWSPRAAILGGTSAVKSVEVSPGVHELLIGPPAGGGPILKRDTSVNTDYTGGAATAYPSWDVKGSIVLCESGEIAEIAHIALKSTKAGKRPTVSILLGEISATNGATWDTLDVTSEDPPGLPESQTIYSDRYSTMQNGVCPKCEHFQLKIDYGTQDAPDELLKFSVYGAKYAERRQA